MHLWHTIGNISSRSLQPVLLNILYNSVIKHPI